nr:ABC transporter permease [uncultured Dyadobacter sp.]
MYRQTCYALTGRRLLSFFLPVSTHHNIYKSVLAITFRTYFRNRTAVLISVFGLAIAIACCISGYFNWKFKNDWDHNHVNSENIYRIQFRSVEPGITVDYGVAPMALAEALGTSMGGVRTVVRYFPSDREIRVGEKTFKSNFAYVDSAFFDLFTFPLLQGVASDLSDKSKIFLSEDAAMRYFNAIDVVGRDISLSGDGATHSFSVGGIFASQPLNSSFSSDAILLYSNLDSTQPAGLVNTSGWDQWNTTFLKIDNPQLVAYVERVLQRFVAVQNKVRHGPRVSRFYLQKFADMANRSVDKPGVRWQQLRYGVPNEAVLVPNITAFLLLLLACFNFTNTSVSIAGTRIREIGVRKTIGAGRWQIAFQFFVENLIFCMIALLLGLAITELIVPAYNGLWPFMKLETRYFDDFYFVLFLAALLFLTALIAGSYPALYVSSFDALAILKGRASVRAGGWFNRLLLGSIFTLSALGVLFAVAFYGNSKFQANYDLGYSTSGVLSITLDKPADFTVVKNFLSGHEDVLSVAGAENHISKGVFAQTAKFGEIEKGVEEMRVGENYLEALGMTIHEGRGFRPDSETDRAGSVLVTEEFVRQFGWRDSAIGKRIVLGDSVGLRIVGVLKDVYTHSVFEPVSPLVVRCAAPGQYRYAIVSSDPSRISGVERFARQQWRQSFPGKLYDTEFIDVVKESTTRVNLNGVKIVGSLAVFSLLISLTGLYTMASLNIARRTKEIGIRRVLGASFGNIIAVINYEYFALLTIAGAVGGVAGYFLIDLVMRTMWQYYLNIAIGKLVCWLLFLLTTGFAILVLKTLFVSAANPTRSLRSE